jgi:deazaflavin-dependent oxidoreductase (nitroreductase family)
MGRKTGQPRTTALVYARDGDHDVVVASYGGAPGHPAWFLNLEAIPRRRCRSVAVPTCPRPGCRGRGTGAPWELVNEKNRGLAPLFHRGVVGRYDLYQRHTRREIPVVIVEPSNHV